MPDQTPGPDPDRYIKAAGVVIAMGLVLASMWVSAARNWMPGVGAAAAVELLLFGWMARDVCRDRERGRDG